MVLLFRDQAVQHRRAFPEGEVSQVIGEVVEHGAGRETDHVVCACVGIGPGDIRKTLARRFLSVTQTRAWGDVRNNVFLSALSLFGMQILSDDNAKLFT